MGTRRGQCFATWFCYLVSLAENAPTLRWKHATRFDETATASIAQLKQCGRAAAHSMTDLGRRFIWRRRDFRANIEA
jgi:hypothetical protein